MSEPDSTAGHHSTGSAREEAERLAAAALAAASVAARGWAATFGSAGSHAGPGATGSATGDSTTGDTAGGAHGFATGTPECCVCPVCKAIAALRDPSPEFAERLVTGASELATGVTDLLRAFGSVFGAAGGGTAAGGESSDSGPADEPSEDDPWAAAVRKPPTMRSSRVDNDDATS